MSGFRLGRLAKSWAGDGVATKPQGTWFKRKVSRGSAIRSEGNTIVLYKSKASECFMMNLTRMYAAFTVFECCFVLVNREKLED